MTVSQEPPLTDADLARLAELVEAVPAPLEPLDPSALDGFLCGVLLQPRPVPTPAWIKYVADIDGRAAPATAALAELHGIALRRHCWRKSSRVPMPACCKP